MKENELPLPNPKFAEHGTGINLSSEQFSQWLQLSVRELGGHDAACLRANSAIPWERLSEQFKRWLADNRGALGYIDRSLGQRCRPFAEMSWARSVIVLTFAADWGNLKLAPALPRPAPGKPVGFISRYACGVDYHRQGNILLQALTAKLEAKLGHPFQSQAAVDTRPLPEVFLGEAAGLGQLGRNGLLRVPQLGSRVFIASLFTDLDLPEVKRQPTLSPNCEDCGRCLQACPTGALQEDGPLRVRLCRSYLSMEWRQALSQDQQLLLGDCLFGCDGCTSCCPPATPPEGIPVDLEWLLKSSAGEIRRCIAGSALEHAGVSLLRRNAVAILNQSPTQEAADLRRWVQTHCNSPVVLETLGGGRHI
jgi:epoxyqueuosine reductase